MIRVDPSPILFIFIFLFDPSCSESIRVDPTRTGGPSWSGPTFRFCICLQDGVENLDKVYSRAVWGKPSLGAPVSWSDENISWSTVSAERLLFQFSVVYTN